MSTEITIPPEAVEAARKAFTEAMLSEPRLEDPITAALRAGIAAWPGMWKENGVALAPDNIILPLPTESTDEKS